LVKLDNVLLYSQIGPAYLVDELEHGSLDFVVAAGSVVESGTANGVDFVEKDLNKNIP